MMYKEETVGRKKPEGKWQKLWLKPSQREGKDQLLSRWQQKRAVGEGLPWWGKWGHHNTKRNERDQSEQGHCPPFPSRGPSEWSLRGIRFHCRGLVKSVLRGQPEMRQEENLPGDWGKISWIFRAHWVAREKSEGLETAPDLGRHRVMEPWEKAGFQRWLEFKLWWITPVWPDFLVQMAFLLDIPRFHGHLTMPHNPPTRDRAVAASCPLQFPCLWYSHTADVRDICLPVCNGQACWKVHTLHRARSLTSTILVIDARFLRTWKRRVGGAGACPSFLDVPFL